jgi:GNAT superfamily N-acetyltransferase
VSELLAAYDTQLRGRLPDAIPAGTRVDRDGPLVRWLPARGPGFVGYRTLDGLDGADLDALIARQVTYFGGHGRRFEWKLHGHDLPADLPERLRAAGFVPEELETVVIAPIAAIAAPPVLPDGVALREVVTRADFDRIAAMEADVWQDDDDREWLADMLEQEHMIDPESLTIVVVEAGDEVVCAAWVRYEPATEFATLWGGATRPPWRGRGIYKATVAYRANLGAARGLRYLEVDASADSRPILQRLGFVPVTTTTPYIWRP